MARHGVTYQDIANAAQQLMGEGKQPTIELVRNILRTGSTTTIANHLRKWRAEQDAPVSQAIKENLPPEFIAVMKGLWQRLHSHAENEIQLFKQESEKNIQGLEEEIEKYKTNNQRWQKMYESWIKDKESLAREKMTLEQGVESLKKEITNLVTKDEIAQTQMLEKQDRIEELNRLHRLAQENLEHYRETVRIQRLTEADKHAEEIQKLEIVIKNKKQDNAILNQEKNQLSEKLSATLKDFELLQVNFSNMQKQLDRTHSAFSTAEKELQKIREEVSQTNKQYILLQKKYDEQNNKYQEIKLEQTVAAKELIKYKEELKELKDQNKLLAQEKWEIAQEKAQLEGINKQMQRLLQVKEAS